MENFNVLQWRSIDTNSDNLDDSVTETINSSLQSCNAQKDVDDYIYENELLHAMNNLQIDVVQNSEQLTLHSDIVTNSSMEVKETVLLNVNKECCENNANILNQSNRLNTALNSSLNYNTSKTIKERAKSPVIESKVKSTKSPSFLPKLKSTSAKISLNRSTIKTENLRDSDKRIIKTITDTDQGIQLKEEKIIHFSIPITVARKKRTEAVPFSFLNRVNNKSQVKNSDKINHEKEKVFMSSNIKNASIKRQSVSMINSNIKLHNKRSSMAVNSNEINQSIPINMPILMHNKKSSLIKRTSTSVVKGTKSYANNTNVLIEKINQEKKIPTVNANYMPKIKSMRVGVAPLNLHTNKRAKERQEFDIMLKRKEKEIENMRAELEKKQREKGKLEELALRKTLEHKANPMPEFTVPPAIRSKKPLTLPQSPAWAFKSKSIK